MSQGGGHAVRSLAGRMPLGGVCDDGQPVAAQRGLDPVGEKPVSAAIALTVWC